MNKYLVLATGLMCSFFASPAFAQDFSPIRLAQANPTIIPTDVTPTGIGEEREEFSI